MLYNRIKKHYSRIYRGLPLYSSKKRLIGEIDILAIGTHGVDVFEVKCSYRPVKARKQLAKIKRILGSRFDDEINTWFYCGEAGLLEKTRA